MLSKEARELEATISSGRQYKSAIVFAKYEYLITLRPYQHMKFIFWASSYAVLEGMDQELWTLNFELGHHMIATGRNFSRRHHTIRWSRSKTKIAGVARVSVGLRSKERPRNGDFRCFARAKIGAKACVLGQIFLFHYIFLACISRR